jgi:outer membrane lipoprotein-sorting protein
MRWLLPAVWLLLGPAPDDAQARELYSALRKKLETAETVSVDFSIGVSNRGRSEDSVSGSIRLKGGDRWRFALQLQSSRRPQMNHETILYSDGKRVVGSGAAPDREMSPKETGAQLRRMLPESLLWMAVFSSPRGDIPEIEPPKEGEIKDGGTETVDGVDARVLLYELSFDRQKISVKSWVDPKRLRVLKRELTMGDVAGVRLTETYSAFVLDAPISDGMFVYASLRRLALARAKQLARSAALYGAFTGRTPASLDELAVRPKDLAETVVWPAGGFVLASAVPKDPWGRPFELRRDGAKLVVSCLGADGKAGGSGDDEDVAADVPFSLRMAVTGPTPRLRSFYEARLQLHLIAAAVKAYRETYGDLPRKKASLFEKPEGEAVWPEGGWLPGSRMPLDAWGEELRLITDVTSARVQVQDPKARALTFKQLTDDERAALEKGGKPVITNAERTAIDGLVKQLRDDDLDTRQKAQDELKRFGPAVDESLATHLATEKDFEAKSRLMEVRRSLPRVMPPWRTELAPLSVVVSGDGQPANIAANERNGSTSLKTICSAEADFRANDRDWNHVNDFWTLDLAGLYTLKDQNGQSIKLIELSVAMADGAPAEAGLAGGRLPALGDFGIPKPKAGYLFRAMDADASEKPAEAYRQDTGGQPLMGKVHNTSRFGFCAYPAEYGGSGIRTFIVNENNTIFWKDTQGEPVLEWPTDADLMAEWKKLD